VRDAEEGGARPFAAASGLLALVILLPGARLAAGDTPPAPSPSPRPPRSILLSVPKAVDRLLAENAPCADSQRYGVPCFATHVEAGPRYSVEEGLRHIDMSGPRPPGPPTVSEMLEGWRFNNNPGRATVDLVQGDPVCAVRSLAKLFTGRNDTYYVYRIVDSFGPRAAMYERPIAPETYAQAPEVSYELVGKFRGECEALKAYRQALREVPLSKDASTASEADPDP
jgi:hypothetical protein